MTMRHRQAEGQAKDRVARQLADGWLRMQTRGARWLGRKANPLPKRIKLAVLLLFAGSAGGLSLYRITGGILAQPTAVLPVVAVKKTAVVRNTKEAASNDSILAAEAYRRIRRFRIRMDSLANSPTGKPLFDRITAARPGLMDSVLWVEKMCQPQTEQQPFDQPTQ
jgi:hypothetical protein